MRAPLLYFILGSHHCFRDSINRISCMRFRLNLMMAMEQWSCQEGHEKKPAIIHSSDMKLYEMPHAYSRACLNKGQLGCLGLELEISGDGL